MKKFDIIFLSPHFDDAVFSCGGEIYYRSLRGEKVGVATVFTSNKTDKITDFGKKIISIMSLTPENYRYIRQTEDQKASHILNFTSLYLHFPEAIFRGVSNFKELFKNTFSSEEEELVYTIAREIDSLETEIVVAPAAIGDHIDHAIVKKAAYLSKKFVVLYEDIPYSKLVKTNKQQRLRITIPLSKEAITKKVEASLAYNSQIIPIFKSKRRAKRLITLWSKKGEKRVLV